MEEKEDKAGQAQCGSECPEKEESAAAKRSNELTWTFKDCSARLDAGQTEEAGKFAEGYKIFLDRAKTEREFAEVALEECQKAGYHLFEPGQELRPGDRVFHLNRNKAVIMTTVGREPLEKGLRITVSHVDSPRLDLKPMPVTEKSGIAYLKTHYYGGIKKYQWVTVPLALHGVTARNGQENIRICIGEKEDEPVFCISDLLPHLASDQMDRKLREAIKGEELTAVAASTPFDPESKEKDLVKLRFLDIMNRKYGITEKDFLTSELSLVPAGHARDVGADGALVGSYGQDDRICAYAALRAELGCTTPAHTTVTVFADKEEIGSCGNTGMNSDFLLHHIQDLCRTMKADERTVLRNSWALSADVGAAFDPVFPSVFDEQNSCHLGKGCVLTKYTGARGKSGSNDASAETLAFITGILDEANVPWQIGEIGAVDAGGGGTVALFIAGMDVNTVDLGVPILSMHSPFELSSKADLYSLYLGLSAFLK